MPTSRARRLLCPLLAVFLSLSLFAAYGPTVQAAQVADTETPSPDPLATVTLEADQGTTGIWQPPGNLSQSGAASGPVIVAEADGSLHTLWWDKFEGTKYAYFKADAGWSQPLDVPTILGARATSQSPEPSAPSQLRLLVDSSSELHAFWIDSRGNLLYARSNAGTNNWSLALQLATAPLAWDVTLSADGSVHLAYIRALNTPQLPAGVYYRLSDSGGQSWDNARLITGSPYFRTLAAEAAHVNVAAGNHALVLVAWDDPQLARSFSATSSTGGKSFDAPVRLEAADALRNDTAVRERFIVLPSGKFLRIWQAGDNCLLYQQESDDAAQNWSAPLRVLETLGGCPRGWRVLPLADDQVLLSISLAEAPSGLELAIWDGVRWSEPVSPRISFVNAATNRPTELGCLDATVTNNHAAVIGCDDSPDVWATVSTVDLGQLLPGLNTAWTPPNIIAGSDGDAELPAVAVERDGRMHLIWGQNFAEASTVESLNYSRGDGTNWAPPVAVLNSPRGGKAETPTLLADASDVLHAVWSGGFAGEVFYSQSFVRDAASASGWSQPVALPAPTAAGGWPALVLDSVNTLHAIYSIPLNESRGVYYTRSTDAGASWSEPQRLFDAAAAGWAMVSETHLAVDNRNRLHATWVQAALPPATTSLGVYYSRSEDGGQSWSEPVQVSSVDTGYPAIVAAGPDEIHLLWAGNLSSAPGLWHQWSSDGGATWSQPGPLLGLQGIAPRADMVTDGAGDLYLVGVERTAQDSAALFFMRWTDQGWAEREDIPLGYASDAAAGATGVLLPNGRLGAIYRLRAPTGTGGSHYVLGYTERPVAVTILAPAATLTPQATDTPLATQAVTATGTPAPTQDLNGTPVEPVSQTDWLRIGGILAAMVAVVIVAMIGLRTARR